MGFGTGIQVGFEMLEALAHSEGIFMSAMQNKALVGKGGFEGLGMGRQGVPHRIGFESVGSPLSGRRTDRTIQNLRGRVGYADFSACGDEDALSHRKLTVMIASCVGVCRCQVACVASPYYWLNPRPT